MKKPKNTEQHINLETLAGGAFAEKLNEALVQVAENIQNPNTDAATKRGITVNIKFTPNKTRQIASASISVTTKLAPTEAIDTQMVMGVNMRTGQIEIAEYDGQIKGQTTLDDFEEPDDMDEDDMTQPSTSGKLLDLKNRNKKENEQAYDPETGEVYENVVSFNKKAIKA